MRILKQKNKKKTTDESDLQKDAQTKEIYNHSKKYSELLNLYVKTTKFNIYLKLIFKILFFLSAIVSMVVIVYLFSSSMNCALDYVNKFKDDRNNIKIEAILGILTIIIPAILSFIIAFLKMPEIIVSYLFNTEEERYMDSIIKSIQDFDKDLFVTMQQKTVDSLLADRSKSITERDDDFEDFDEIDDPKKKITQNN